MIPRCAAGSTLGKAVTPAWSGAAQLPYVQTEVSKEHAVGKEGAMASSPNIVHQGWGWMSQVLILWKPGVGFCLGISL